MKRLLGIDLGGTTIKEVLLDETGQILRQDSTPTLDTSDCNRWKEAIRSMVSHAEAGSIGLSAPGLANREGTQITLMPGRLHGLERFDWEAFLGRSVRVLNDAHAALLGEAWLGAARGCRHVVMLTLGTGVGGAVQADGRLLRGAIGRAGHFGHLSLDPSGKPDIAGTPGSLEEAIGECTVRQRSGYASTRELVEAAQLGVPEARTAWLESVRALAAAVASLINAFDPERVVIGGGISAAGRALFDPLEHFLNEMEWRPAGHRVPVVPATLGGWAGAIGAASYAFYGEEPRIS